MEFDRAICTAIGAPVNVLEITIDINLEYSLGFTCCVCVCVCVSNSMGASNSIKIFFKLKHSYAWRHYKHTGYKCIQT